MFEIRVVVDEVDYPKLADRLLERGLDETILNQIFWSNALGVIDKCSM